MSHKIIGATIRATNRGLAPARPWGSEETVAEVACEYDMTIRTIEGNTYMNGSYTNMCYAEAARTRSEVATSTPGCIEQLEPDAAHPETATEFTD